MQVHKAESSKRFNAILMRGQGYTQTVRHDAGSNRPEPFNTLNRND